jgi:N6-L-threonylcarbamoyladenine synthase
VNHLHAHLYACQLGRPEPVFPCLGFVISGGHTSLFDCPDPATYTLLGGTIDDAAGEAFDKAAQLLGLPYPGGPSIARAARSGSATAHRFPRSFADDPRRLAFSFSGLKTALRYQIQPPGAEQPRLLTDAQRADLASSFQQAVVDALVAKALHALDHTRRDTLCVGGGVAANTLLRDTLAAALARRRTRTRLILAPPELCVDNAVMGALAWERLRLGQSDSLDIDITPGLVR